MKKVLLSLSLVAGLFASDKKEVNDYASLKYSGIIIKVEKATQPVELVLKQLKTKLLKKIKKRKIY